MRILIAALFTLLAGPAIAQAPLEAYGETPEIRSIDFSPDGSRFAFFLRNEGKQLMVVFENGKGNIGVTDLGEAKPRGLVFVSNHHVLFYVSETSKAWKGGFENTQAFSFNIETGEVMHPAEKEHRFRFYNATAGFSPTPTSDPDTAHFTARVGQKGDRPSSALLKGNLKTGKAKIVAKGSPYTIDWLITEDGVIIGREDFNDENNYYRIYTYRNGSSELVYEERDIERPTVTLSSYLPDQSALLVWREIEGQPYNTLHKLSFDGEISEPVYDSAQRNLGGLYTDDWDKMIGVWYAGLRPSYYFLDSALDADMKNLSAAAPHDSVSLVDWIGDFEKLVLYVDGGKTSPAYFLYDRATGSLEKVTNTYLRIPDEEIEPVDLIDYPARDGLLIPSLLTHPRGAKPGDKLPLIVYPHGGPESYVSLGFNYRAQYFASRGYIVLQPNFRGSTGFGVAHRRAGYGEWGGKMQDDITDGVNHLINNGWADPNRVCIMGASYGGYAALAGGAFTPDLYQCVIAVAPVTDMNMMVEDDKSDYGKHSATMDYLEELLGDMINDPEKLAAISPANAAGAFKAPVLLLHGTDDTVVPFKHSEKMDANLNAARKPVTFVTLEGEDHYMSFSETRLQALQEIDRFVRETIGPAQ